MTRARDIANLADANGDIVAGALDNVRDGKRCFCPSYGDTSRR